jgi:hypothetical protein
VDILPGDGGGTLRVLREGAVSTQRLLDARFKVVEFIAPDE